MVSVVSGVLGYFWDAGEVFDFVIVVASLVALISGKYPNLNMARIFRYASLPFTPLVTNPWRTQLRTAIEIV